LKRAKELGTFLYVGVHDDATVNKIKGHNFPIMNLHERVLNVLSCKYVDEVIIGAPWKISSDMIKTLNINYAVAGSATKFADDVLPNTKQLSPSNSHSSSQAILDPTDPYYEAKKMGIYKEIDSTKFLSTSEVIERIIENRLKFEKRNTKRSAKEVDYLTQKKEREYISEI
jgi:ethanolamine-phosphate cytidylyltransferase